MLFLIVEEKIPDSMNNSFTISIKNTHMILVVRSTMSRTIEHAHRKRQCHL